MLPTWKGWRAKAYGPNARYKIPYMSRLFWEIEGRAWWLSFKRPWKNVPRVRRYRAKLREPFQRTY